MLRWDIVILLLVLLSSSHILNTQYLPTNPLFHNFRQKSFRGRTIRWEYKSWAIKKHLAKKSKWCGATFVAAFTMLLCWDSAVTLPTETLVANYLYALLIFQNNNYIYALLICHNNNNAWHPEPKSTLIIFREESKSATTKKLNTNLTRPEKSGNLYICSLSSLSVSPLNFCSFFYECFFNTFSRRSSSGGAKNRKPRWQMLEQKMCKRIAVVTLPTLVSNSLLALMALLICVRPHSFLAYQFAIATLEWLSLEGSIL